MSAGIEAPAISMICMAIPISCIVKPDDFVKNQNLTPSRKDRKVTN